MPTVQDITGAVVADTVYVDNTLVARDTEFTLPGLTFLTADVQAMGTMSVPLIGLLEHMELAVKKIGTDKGLGKMNKLEKQNLEFRWVQNIVKTDGSMKTAGCKAFVRTMPAAVPETAVALGAATEHENTYGVTRMQIFADGEEILCVDRLSQILRMNGKDYMKEITSLL